MRALFVVLALAVTTGAWAEVVISAHLHTTHSDGMGTMREVVDIVRENGAQVAILSDHAEMIGLPYVYMDVYPWAWSVDKPKPRLLIQHKEMGVDSWVSRIQESYPIQVVPGMEVGLGETRSSHLLYWGGDISAYTEVVEISKTATFLGGSSVQYLAVLAQKSGAVLVEPHPFNDSYPYAEGAIRLPGLTWGIEYFNGTVPQQIRCFLRMVKLQAQLPDQHIIATGGTDFHWSYADVLTNLAHVVEGIDLQRGNSFEPCMWRRTIAVRCPDTSAESVNSALLDGRCYAAFDGGRSENRILSASAMPGESFQPTPDDRIFKMQIRGLEKSDEVTIGVASRDGGAKTYAVTGDRHVEDGVGIIAVDLDLVCPRTANCGWWLFVMTPEVVTSAIEILPWPRELQIVPRVPSSGGTVATTPPVTARPPTTTMRPPAATPVSQDPMALISQYPRRYHGVEEFGFYFDIFSEAKRFTIESWAGFDSNWRGRVIVCYDGVWRDEPITLQIEDGHGYMFLEGSATVDPHEFGGMEVAAWRIIWKSVSINWDGGMLVDSTGTLSELKLWVRGESYNSGEFPNRPKGWEGGDHLLNYCILKLQ